MGRPSRLLTSAQDAEILFRRQSGETEKSIADDLGVSRGCVRKALRRLLGFKANDVVSRGKNKRRYKNRVSNGRCPLCGDMPSTGKTCCDKCLARAKASRVARREKGLCTLCFNPSGSESRCDPCKARQDKIRLRAKLDAFNAYGGCVCACCGETELAFLTLDHVNNNGAAERRIFGSAGAGEALYRRLRRFGFPAGYAVLCMNCNFAKGHCGICPHKVPKGMAL